MQLRYLLHLSASILLLTSSHQVLAFRKHGHFAHAEHVLHSRRSPYNTPGEGCVPYKELIAEAFNEGEQMATASVHQVSSEEENIQQLKGGLWGTNGRATPDNVITSKDIIYPYTNCSEA